MLPLLLALLARPALADQVIAGDQLRIWFDSTGTWNDQDAGRGIEALHDGVWWDWAYAGYPWQMLAFAYVLPDDSLAYYANSYTESATCTVSDESDLTVGDQLVSSYTYEGTGASIVQTESWARDGKEIRVNLHVTATGSDDLGRLALYFELDPDPDGPSGVYETLNDTVDTDADGLDDLVLSSSATTGYALGFGACDPSIAELGHNASWSSSYSSRPVLTDNDSASADSAMGIRYAPVDALAAGASVDLTFVVIEGDTVADVEAAWASTDLCGGCDDDGDGFDAVGCGGADCDDADPDVRPDAAEVWYDGVDQDCDGADDYDQDGDGHDSADVVPDGATGPGDDCDDTNPDAYPGAEDPLYDGVDADCSGDSDYDADGDGYDSDDFGGDDCNDNDPAINPAAAEVYYDDVDQDCDGNDDDADGDGYDSPLDCDDTNADIYPGAAGVSGDGVDSDCDGDDADATAPAGDDTGDVVKVGGGCGCATPSRPGSLDWAGVALAVGALLRSRRRG